MASIFNSINIGYSGLNVAQVGINTTSNNIANAESEGYTRQRVVIASATPMSITPGQVGNGAQLQDIERVFDNFVFTRYSGVSADKEYSDYEKKTLEELSSYFPEVDGVGIKSDLSEYYNMWQTFADNPDNDAIKIALASQTQTLTDHIDQTREQIFDLQMMINEELAVNINEVNDLTKQIADLNIAIDTAEAAGENSANELRDKRNVLERTLSRLIGAEVTQDQLTSNTQIDSNSNIRTGSYTLSVNGFNIVDGNTSHPIKLTKDDNARGFYSISYERQDGTLLPMEEDINSGKIGAILDLRGGAIDNTSGMPVDGIIQKTLTQFDAFAKGMIEGTNNIYAANAVQSMESNSIDIAPDRPLLGSGYNIHKGSFDIVVYDTDGNEVAVREIKIDTSTTLEGAQGSNSIQGQMIKVVDDNDDGNANNDIDDIVVFNYSSPVDGEDRLSFTMDPSFKAKGYTFAIRDKLEDNSFSSGTNFAGALGMSRYFDGDSASTMRLSLDLRDNPTHISAGYSSVSGDNRIALDMVQQQFEEYEFKVDDQIYDTTVYGMFDVTATYVGVATNSAITRNETITTKFNATELEYQSISKVSIDEEMTNLIKFQTAYGAAAKVITTIDQMTQTLLGIKQ